MSKPPPMLNRSDTIIAVAVPTAATAIFTGNPYYTAGVGLGVYLFIDKFGRNYPGNPFRLWFIRNFYDPDYVDFIEHPELRPVAYMNRRNNEVKFVRPGDPMPYIGDWVKYQ